MVRGLFLLTMKPVTYAANVAESDLADQVLHPTAYQGTDGICRASCVLAMHSSSKQQVDSIAYVWHRLLNFLLQGASNTHVQALRKKADEEGRQVVIVSAQVRAGGSARVSWWSSHAAAAPRRDLSVLA